MGNKVFVITGATSGIGKALAMDLAKTGEVLVMVARAVERGNAALQEIRLATQNFNISLELCDLAIPSSVRNLAEILKSKYEKIDVLINNAGVYKRKREVTVDGFEEMFAANHLGPFSKRLVGRVCRAARITRIGTDFWIHLLKPSPEKLQK